MPTLKKVRPISVEEYLEGEKVSDTRHEFVGGEVFSMVGASQTHNLIAAPFSSFCKAISGAHHVVFSAAR